ncbi:MAG: hypothetical protein KAU89_02475, partial [Candidatus Thorarchaeota archaeon]|nr:hypothetical protein [Candidatus Thorarchaeota archaeon]
MPQQKRWQENYIHSSKSLVRSPLNVSLRLTSISYDIRGWIKRAEIISVKFPSTMVFVPSAT